MKFINKSKLHDKIVSYTYQEDTDVPFIKRRVTVESDGYEAIVYIYAYNKKFDVSFCDWNGNRINNYANTLNRAFFKYNDSIYWVKEKNVEICQNPPEAVKVFFMDIDVKNNEATEFLMLLQEKGIHVIAGYDNIVVASKEAVRYFNYDISSFKRGLIYLSEQLVFSSLDGAINTERLDHEIIRSSYFDILRFKKYLTEHCGEVFGL